jgi:hypothetical protein
MDKSKIDTTIAYIKSSGYNAELVINPDNFIPGAYLKISLDNKEDIVWPDEINRDFGLVGDYWDECVWVKVE